LPARGDVLFLRLKIIIIKGRILVNVKYDFIQGILRNDEKLQLKLKMKIEFTGRRVDALNGNSFGK